MPAGILTALPDDSAGMTQGEFLLSPDSRLQFILQQDGNAVLYRGRFDDQPRQPLWSMGKAQPVGDYVIVLHAAGHLCVYPGRIDQHGTTPLSAVLASGDASLGCFLSLQNDENLVLYQGSPSAPGEAIWSSRFGETMHDFTALLLQGRHIVGRRAVRARNSEEVEARAETFLREHNAEAERASRADSVLVRRDSAD